MLNLLFKVNVLGSIQEMIEIEGSSRYHCAGWVDLYLVFFNMIEPKLTWQLYLDCIEV